MADEEDKQEQLENPGTENQPEESAEQQTADTEAAEKSSVQAYLDRDKITWADIQQHIGGPVISTVLHIIILIVAGTAIIAEAPKPPKEEIVVEMKEVEIVKPPEPPKQEQEVEEVEQVNFAAANPMNDRPQVQTDVIATNVEDVQTTNAVADIDIPTNVSTTVSNSALKLPGMMKSRSTDGIKTSIKLYGGTAKGESSVKKALDWLQKNQNPDGSWGKGGPTTALTAVATLAFLAHGETPMSAKYGETMMKALKKLVSYTNTIHGERGVIANGGNGYAHAMVAYAISEGYGMTKIPMLRSAMDKIIRTIVKGQNKQGGFDYNLNIQPLKPDPKTGKIQHPAKRGDYRCDLSVGGWTYQAMKAAYAAGCTVEGLHKAIENASKCIRTVNNGKLIKRKGVKPHSTFTYNNSYGKIDGGIAMTSVGTLCLQLFGDGKSKEAKNGLQYIELYQWGGDAKNVLTMDWHKYQAAGSMALYTWYYATQAIFQGHSGDGKEWNKWNKSFRTVLTREQNADGSWDAPHVKYGKPDPKNPGMESNAQLGGQLGQRVWSTSMCTLMLEVYYRFLPTFKTASQPAVKEASGSDEDDDDISLD